MQMYKAGEH